MDDLKWDGTLLERDFYLDAAQVFAENWKKINPNSPPWSWVTQRNPLTVSMGLKGESQDWAYFYLIPLLTNQNFWFCMMSLENSMSNPGRLLDVSMDFT